MLFWHKMHISSFFRPFIKLEVSSLYNYQIKVYERFGKNRLSVNGTDQTGPYLENVFNKAFSSYKINLLSEVKSVLLFGLGGGCVIPILEKIFPSANFSCVDIDEVIINIAKKYFNLQKFSNLKFITSDANDYIKSEITKKNKFDFIVVDLFNGNEVSKLLNSYSFITGLSSILNNKGKVLINYQGIDKYKYLRKQLFNNLNNIFINVKVLNINQNMVYFVSK